MSNQFWAADGDFDRQTAFAIGPPGNAGGADDEAGAAAEAAGDMSGRVRPFPASLAPGQKVGNSRYANFLPQVPGSMDSGRDGDADDYSQFGTVQADNIDQAC